MPITQFPAVFNLANLNGFNGFKIDGESANDQTLFFFKMNSAGDMNGDGYTDLIIGAHGHNSNTGRSYVIFGGSNVGNSGILSLASLNGVNGFKIDGESVGDASGIYVSTAGDFNMDGYADIVIGAIYCNSNTGRSYVIYGSSHIGNNGLISLASLNGTNGFKIDGESGSQSGVIYRGSDFDFNGDHYPDLLIGGKSYAGSTGRSYVMYGSPTAGNLGLVSLANLNGTNGFKLDGEATNDASGDTFSLAKDFNYDGYPDLLIGAQGHASSTGRAYVVYGGVDVGSSGLIPLSNLNSTNGFKLDGEATFNVFCPIFDVGDINADGYRDLGMGAHSYNSNTGRGYILFGGPNKTFSSVISASSLDGINGFKMDAEAGSDNLGQSLGPAGDFNHDGYADLLIGAYGHNNNIGRSYVMFGQPGIGAQGIVSIASLNNSMVLKLDGENAGDYSGSILAMIDDINGDGLEDLAIGACGYNSATGRTYIIFGDVAPQLFVNKLIIHQGQTIIFSAQNFNATDNAPVQFSISNVSHGQFEWVSAPGQTITAFNQSQVLSGQVQFVHDDSHVAPAYLVQTPNTGIALTPPPEAANITFYCKPVLLKNQLTIRQSQTVLINSLMLNVLDDYPGTQVNFTLTALQHGQFLLAPLNNSVTQFTAAQLQAGQVFFAQDGTSVAPSYQVSVSDPYFTLSPSAASVAFLRNSTTQFPIVFNLSDLNGLNGFKIDGEAKGDESGFSVSSAGDINGDSYADLLIGAYIHNNGTGRSYVVFGGPAVGNAGLFSLSNLNGTNGFKLDGETAGDLSGFHVSSAGDIDSDGYADLLIGAPQCDYSSACAVSYGPGRSYVVFGGTSVGTSGLLALSSLNGINGFKLGGEATGDWSGDSVGSAGDINGDGWMDLLIGASIHNSNSGRSYVVFGGSGAGSGGLISLASLTGTNGFKLDGETTGDLSGTVSSIGDINGDGHADLLIGAYGHNNQTGRSYVVFGEPGVGSGGVIALSSLNGTNGFKLDGETPNDRSGVSVSKAGDINADGYADFSIGADGYATNSTGHSYVIFGKPEVNNSNLLPLANLNGINGFKLNGEAPGDGCGHSISDGGDINGDGWADLIVASGYHNSQTGRSYVVFGNLVFGNLGIGSGGTFNLSSLNGVNGFKLDGEAINDQNGFSVSSAGDINGDGLADLLIGAPYHNNSTGRSYVVFGDIAPQLLVNQLTIKQDQKIIFSAQNLNTIDNAPVQFNITSVSHGQFEFVSSPNQAITAFSQSQVLSGQVQFVHDGSEVTPSYFVQTPNTGIALTPPPEAANITFVFPQLLQNQLTIANGETIVFSSAQLQAAEPTFNNSALVFFTGIVQQGRFASTITNQTLSEFTQADIQSGKVEFVHTGNKKAPGYYVSVSDSAQITSPHAAAITFIGAPVITQNSVNITQGGAIILTPADLDITITDGSNPGQVTLEVVDLQNAQIISNITNGAVSNFTLAQLQSGDISLVQNGDPQAPSYTITATSSNSGLTSPPSTVNTSFSHQGVYAPRMAQNYLYVTEGESTVLTPKNLQAITETGQAVDDSALFYVTDVSYGQFTLLSDPTTTIPFFSPVQLRNQSVQFTQDGSRNPPAYRASVSYLGLQSASIPAAIFFHTVNQAPQLENPLADQNIEFGIPWSFVIPKDTFSDPDNDPLTLSVSLLPAWLNFSMLNQRLSGTPDQVGATAIAITAKDPAGLSAETDFTVHVLPAPAPKSSQNFNTAIITAAVTGSIGLLFFLLKIGLKRASNKKLLDALGEGNDVYDLNVVRPIAKEIARRVKVTGFMNYTTNTEMANFKGAVRSLLAELSARQVDLDLDHMEIHHRDAVINEIATQAQAQLAVKHDCCTRAYCASFFKPPVTPEDIRRAAPGIATAVSQTLQTRSSIDVSSISMQTFGGKTGKLPNKPVEEIEIRTYEM